MALSTRVEMLAGARRLLSSTAMRSYAFVMLAACGGGGSMVVGDDTNVDAPPATECALPDPEGASSGTVTALGAQRCNVPGSMGSQHWYRLLGAMPSGAMDIVQLELWPNLGAFAGGTVHTGTFQIGGDDADYTKCGVCVRAVGKHGDTANQMLYFATAGTVEVTSFGDAPTAFTATITNAMFEEVDANGAKTGTCATTIPSIMVSGPTENKGGTGGGGGGGGGSGTGGCVRTVGDL